MTGARRSGLGNLETVLMYAATALVGGTGIAYGWFRYFATPVDPFSVVAHPWQPLLQHLHVLSAPALVFAAGALWRPHVVATWKRNGSSRRRSGVFLALSTFPMIVSGYLVQVAVEASWRRTWGVVHSIVSLVWLAGSAIHLLKARTVGASQSPDQKPSRYESATSLPASGTSNRNRDVEA
jgi:hypothetical protein